MRDLMGKVAQEINLSGPTVEIRRVGLAAGVYFLELRENGKVLGVGKVVWE